MAATPKAMDEKGKVLDNQDMLAHPRGQDEAPDDESGEDPHEEPEDDEIDGDDNPVTVGEPE